MTSTLADHWDALASAALLGTQRHVVADPPPGVLADLVADRSPRDGTPHDRADVLLDEVCALSALQRGGLRANPALPTLVPCSPDHRPLCPPGGVACLQRVIGEWPHLVDEWLARVAAAGWALPGDVTVLLLARFRADPQRRAIVAGLAGDLAAWLSELFPDQLVPSRSSVKAGAEPAEEPPLPEELVALGQLAPSDLAAALAEALARGRFANRHRALLVRLVSSVGLDHLAALADTLSRAGTNPDTLGLALTLADLANTRLDLIRELTP